jgi:hypothetical protein
MDNNDSEHKGYYELINFAIQRMSENAQFSMSSDPCGCSASIAAGSLDGGVVVV